MKRLDMDRTVYLFTQTRIGSQLFPVAGMLPQMAHCLLLPCAFPGNQFFFVFLTDINQINNALMRKKTNLDHANNS